jgi:hypothetical protein
MGNAFTKHYDLYAGDNEHSALLHRSVFHTICGRFSKRVAPLEVICGTPCVFMAALSSLRCCGCCQNISSFGVNAGLNEV